MSLVAVHSMMSGCFCTLPACSDIFHKHAPVTTTAVTVMHLATDLAPAVQQTQHAWEAGLASGFELKVFMPAPAEMWSP